MSRETFPSLPGSAALQIGPAHTGGQLGSCLRQQMVGEGAPISNYLLAILLLLPGLENAKGIRKKEEMWRGVLS